ncbi:MAG: cytochrome c [Candidatus Brocadiaceae bacterium]|nr:cytochrome c [Candidatus Brocadiaceae bacterium]
MARTIGLFLVFLFSTGTLSAQPTEELKRQLDETREQIKKQQEIIEGQKVKIEALEKALRERIPPEMVELELLQRESIERGKKVYSSKGCIECHGEEGQGGKGPALKGVTLKYGEEFLVLSVTNSAISHGPKPLMPAFTELQADEVRDVINFLATFVPGRENQERIERGKRLWNKLGCLQCHGLKGEGGVTGPALIGITKKYKYDWVRICITTPAVHHGRKTEMPAFSEVPFMDVEAVIDFMNTF